MNAISSPTLNQWLPAPMPLLGLPGLTAMASDETDLAQLLSPFFAASSLNSQHKDGQFHNVLSGLQIGNADLMAMWNSAMSSSGDVRHGVSLVIAYEQPGVFDVDGSTFLAGDRPFVLPQGPYAYRADEVHGLVLGLNPAELVRIAQAMTGDHSDRLRQRIEGLLQRPHSVDLTDPRSRAHLHDLKHTFWMVDQAVRRGDDISPMLAIDDLLARLALLLICPDLEPPGETGAIKALLPSRPGKTTRADRALNQLVDWVLADLQRPISLSDMELHTGYSRRTLQKAFQERFGMGPMQWLRRQRLLQAKRMVESSKGKLKLGAIAQACGYHNPAGFSRDFHEVFGMRPSDLGRTNGAG